MSETPALRVFISYARRDCTEFAEELLAGLDVAGFDPFLDKHDIAAGEDWEARLGGLISAADTVVFVISPASVASERCAWEVAKAEELSKRIIPVVALSVNEQEAPQSLKRRNYIFFSEGHSFARGLGELAKALRTDLQWVREHTRLGELAIRWHYRGRLEPLLLRGSELDAAKEWLAGWQAPAPEPTELHRAFIGESEVQEAGRFAEERARLEAIALAQEERELLLRRVRMGAQVSAGATLLLLAAVGVGAWQVVQANSRVSSAEGRVLLTERELEDARAELSDIVSQLTLAQTTLDSNARIRSERQASATRQLEDVQRRLERTPEQRSSAGSGALPPSIRSAGVTQSQWETLQAEARRAKAREAALQAASEHVLQTELERSRDEYLRLLREQEGAAGGSEGEGQDVPAPPRP